MAEPGWQVSVFKAKNKIIMIKDNQLYEIEIREVDNTTNLFFMKIPWKCFEKPMNFFPWPWKQRFRISWCYITSWNFHEILYQLFSRTMKSLQSYEYAQPPFSFHRLSRPSRFHFRLILHRRKWRLFSVMIVHVGAGRLFVFFFPVKVIWLII